MQQVTEKREEELTLIKKRTLIGLLNNNIKYVDGLTLCSIQLTESSESSYSLPAITMTFTFGAYVSMIP